MVSPVISPMFLLVITIVVTLIALVTAKVVQRHHREVLSNLAKQWGMQYSPRDVFNLASRVSAHLPVTGASDVRVRDLIYGTDSGGGHRCVFSAEYTAGVVRSKTRQRCVVCIVELLDRPTQALDEQAALAPGAQHLSGQKPASLLQIAPRELSLVEQYETLRSAGQS